MLIIVSSESLSFDNSIEKQLGESEVSKEDQTPKISTEFCVVIRATSSIDT